jgi:hypothetical protein
MSMIMTIADLRVGDIIRGKASGDSYVVTAIYGDRATAVRTMDVTNPAEWERVERVHRSARVDSLYLQSLEEVAQRHGGKLP